MEINRNTKIYFSKDGYLVENAFKFSKKNLFFLLRRLFSFVIDISIIAVVQISFYIMIHDKTTKLLLATIIPIIMCAMYYGVCIIMFQRTFGQRLMGLVISSKDGFLPEKRNLFTRFMLSVLFAFPYVGWFLMVVSFFTALYTNGITWLEGVSKTNLVNEKTQTYLVSLEIDENKQNNK